MKLIITILSAVLLLQSYQTSKADDQPTNQPKAAKEDVCAEGNQGEIACIDDYPYTAAVMIGSIHCSTATILNENWLLTSASTALLESPSKMLIRVGSNTSNEAGLEFQVEKVVPYPNFTMSWTYDVALIKLATQLQYNKTIQPIEIASNAPGNGEIGIIAGFGPNQDPTKSIDSNNREGILRARTMNILTSNICSKYYEKICDASCIGFCATVNQTDKTEKTKLFDYGSPLVSNKQLVGIFASAPHSVTVDLPAAFSDVTQMKEWIEKTIKNGKKKRNKEEKSSTAIDVAQGPY